MTSPALVDDVAAALEARLPGAVTRNASIADLTTYRVGGPAAVLVRVTDEDALREVAGVVAETCVPVLVVGRGSNLLVAEAGFSGVAIALCDRFDAVDVDARAGVVGAGGSAPLPVVARRAASAGVGGLEFLVGIPGSVGGAVKMNAGGHGRETREVLECAWVLDLAAGESAPVEERDGAALDFSYRHSNLQDSHIVLGARLQGAPDAIDECEARIADIVRWRREHQPGGSNAGSVFQNPPGDSAGRLIDAAGLKGLRVGGAFVSDKHANFFQAEPGATADDVAGLIALVRTRVADATGVTLEPELRMIGFSGVNDTPQQSAVQEDA
ncbi:MAG: UDP-N-acetylmuramate dehydrogenase [Actinobacteria bacterium]|nr:UDP-N-acetylmuramate dehydrogenase [Actinomycetota bacterium]